VHVLVPEHRDWRRPERNGAIHYHPYRYSPARSWTPWGFSESLSGGLKIRKPLYAMAPVVFASAVRTARRVMGDADFDLIHVHWVLPNGPIGAVAARRGDLPLVTSLHGSDVAVSERSRVMARAARWSFSRSAAVTAPSGDLLERATRLGASGVLERIPYGADAASFEVRPGAAETVRRRLGFESHHLVVAAVGRFVPMKGFEYLVEAHATALESAPELRLVFVGDGDMRSVLEARVREFGVSDSVVLAGSADHTQIPEYMAAADIVAVPSIRHRGYVDGLPNVALEAMAAGKPLVGSRVGGIPELIREGENGLLVPEKDAGALAEALVSLARDTALRERLGAKGLAEVRTERSWEAVGQRFVDVYERALLAR
jgi:glycosyltransferase involved in cell wall biosynthesis